MGAFIDEEAILAYVSLLCGIDKKNEAFSHMVYITITALSQEKIIKYSNGFWKLTNNTDCC